MKEYRQNSHAASLVFWAGLCTATAIVLFAHSHKVVSRALKAEEILGLRLITIHNLHFYLNLTRRIRTALENETFEEFRQRFIANYVKYESPEM